MDNSEFRKNAEQMMQGFQGMVSHLKKAQDQMIANSSEEDKKKLAKLISDSKINESSATLMGEFERLQTILKS